MNTHIEIYKSVLHVATSGGEGWIDGDYDDNYCIEFGDVSLNGIRGADLARLCEEAVNHLRLSGHVFEWHQVNCQDQPRILKYGGTI